MAFPTTVLPVRVEIAPGADPAADPGTWTWVDITSSVRLEDQIHITQGRADEAARVDPSTCRLRLDNRSGNFTPRNPLGTWYGTLGRNTPLRVRVDPGSGAVTRFSGFVSSWPPRWDKSGNDATVPIEANGVLRRLGQGTPPERSPVWRTHRAGGPVGYWPCEDGGDADRGASAFADHPPMTTSGTVTFEAIEAVQYVTVWGQLVFGTEPLPDLSAGGSLMVGLPGDVSAACSAAGEWAMQCIAQTDVPNASGDIVLLDIATPGGTYVRWQVVNTSGLRERVLAYDAAGASTVVCDSLGVTTSVAAHRIGLKQNGANIDVSMWHGTNAPTDTGSIAGTLAAPTSVTVNSTAATVSTQFPFGHLSVWDAAGTVLFSNGATDSYGVPVGGAMLSFANEAAHDRITRLCAEDGVTLSMPAVSSEFVTRMGPQPTSALLDLLYACAEADQGVIYESGFGLGYVPREQLYNRDTALALDFDQGQVAEPPEPTDDDQQLRNRVIVRRTGGSSATAEDADSIAEVGLYQNEVSVNHADDAELADHAAWRVHLGT